MGVRLGNWLTADQGRRLLRQGDLMTVRERRDHAMLAVLIGCGLRRGELLALRLESRQQRGEHWVIAAGGELDQIQFLLGHVSIQTTERYLGCKQKLRVAVNDTLGIEPEPKLVGASDVLTGVSIIGANDLAAAVGPLCTPRTHGQFPIVGAFFIPLPIVSHAPSLNRRACLRRITKHWATYEE